MGPLYPIVVKVRIIWKPTFFSIIQNPVSDIFESGILG